MRQPGRFVAKLRERFAASDGDGSGAIDHAEFEKLLADLGVTILKDDGELVRFEGERAAATVDAAGLTLAEARAGGVARAVWRVGRADVASSRRRREPANRPPFQPVEGVRDVVERDVVVARRPGSQDLAASSLRKGLALARSPRSRAPPTRSSSRASRRAAPRPRSACFRTM